MCGTERVGSHLEEREKTEIPYAFIETELETGFHLLEMAKVSIMFAL